MTYPDDVLKAAREAAIGAVNALHWGGLGIPETYRARTESGRNDHTTEVQAAARAIMAERQRCAGIARAAKGPLEGKDTLFPEEVAQWESCEEIEQALLGQQEKEP